MSAPADRPLTEEEARREADLTLSRPIPAITTPATLQTAAVSTCPFVQGLLANRIFRLLRKIGRRNEA